jgi:L,D-peptidoglycan transpeptidase YkuD (ErfK/YbiS/YcfS/YnhG family)
VFYNQFRCHTGLTGVTPAQRSGAPPSPLAHLNSYRWRQHCNGLFQTPAAA